MSDERDSVTAQKGVGQQRLPGVPTKTRSPNFPAITLEIAVRRARDLLRGVGRIPTDEEVISGVWNLSTKSSSFRLTLAALRYYGLLVDQPGPKGDLVKLSPLALDIIEDFPEGSPQQREAIRKAATTPKVYNTLYTKYGPVLPADAEVRRYLVREHEPPFNDNTVDEFIGKYKASMSFARIAAGDRIEDEVDPESSEKASSISVGDLVQWTSAGAEMFSEPRPVLGLSDDGQYAFVPGTKSGLPVGQLTAVGHTMTPSETQGSPPVNPFAGAPLKREQDQQNPPTGFKEDAYDLSEGRAVLRWPEKLEPESVEELEDWFALIIRKMRRTTISRKAPGAD